jgi:ribosomal protein S18 acetylase RimI-like enzyme
MRRYEAPDFPRYAALINTCFAELRQANNCLPFVVYPAQADHSSEQARLLTQCDNIFLCFVGDELAGVGNIDIPDVAEVGSEGQFSIDVVAVAPAFRGQGLGTHITQYCVNRLLERGAVRITLGNWVPPESSTTVAQVARDISISARSMYEKLGFVYTGTNESARWYR